MFGRAIITLGIGHILVINCHCRHKNSSDSNNGSSSLLDNLLMDVVDVQKNLNNGTLKLVSKADLKNNV